MGLVAPEQHDHLAGKNLILLALKSTSYSKGPWASSIGLLGVQMLNTDIYSAQGYKSLFTTNLIADFGFKLYGITLIGNNSSILSIESKSMIARREAAIFGIGKAFFGRYCSSPAGEIKTVNEDLKRSLESGLKVYLELKGKGYDDKTLNNALNIARASLDSDKVVNGDVGFNDLGLWQVHQDALNAALKNIREKGWLFSESTFAGMLNIEMSIRGLSTYDDFLLPKDDRVFAVLLKIVELDLESIENK